MAQNWETVGKAEKNKLGRARLILLHPKSLLPLMPQTIYIMVNSLQPFPPPPKFFFFSLLWMNLCSFIENMLRRWEAYFGRGNQLQAILCGRLPRILNHGPLDQKPMCKQKKVYPYGSVNIQQVLYFLKKRLHTKHSNKPRV